LACQQIADEFCSTLRGSDILGAARCDAPPKLEASLNVCTSGPNVDLMPSIGEASKHIPQLAATKAMLDMNPNLAEPAQRLSQTKVRFKIAWLRIKQFGPGKTTPFP
jgi:hypothetical protein